MDRVSAEHERLYHEASRVVESAVKRHGAAMAVAAGLEEIRTGLNHPNGSWTESERRALSRLRQHLETALERLEP